MIHAFREVADTPMIRRAVVSDLEALLALERRCFTGDLLSRRAMRYHLRNPFADILLDEEDGVVRGYVLLFRHARARLARLYSLAVAPESRGKGLAEALVRAAEKGSGKRGCRLEIRQDNLPARTLYERLGYIHAGERPGFYEDGATALLMTKIF